MFYRQRAILRLLHNEGGPTSRLRLVKLAFLLSQELEVSRTSVYEFLPYLRGPFSFTLYHDLRGLSAGGWVTEGDREVSLVQSPDLQTTYLDRDFVRSIDNVSSSVRGLSTPALVDRVYRDYPWFTINSEAFDKRATSRPVGRLAVYTVGYEGIMVDGLLNLLLANGVQRLVDVRSNPIARRYGFHKSTLQRLCTDLGLEYLHMPSLGIPSSWRTELGDSATYDRLFSRYEREILPAQADDIARVAALVQDRPSALMCMEADHTFCHRSRLATRVSHLTALPVQELR